MLFLNFFLATAYLLKVPSVIATGDCLLQSTNDSDLLEGVILAVKPNRTVNKGASLTFVCTSTKYNVSACRISNGRVNATWSVGVGLSKTEIHFTNVTEDHEGNYTCQCITRTNARCTKHNDPVEVIVKVLPLTTTATTTTTTTTTAAWVTTEKTTTTNNFHKLPFLADCLLESRKDIDLLEGVILDVKPNRTVNKGANLTFVCTSTKYNVSACHISNSRVNVTWSVNTGISQTEHHFPNVSEDHEGNYTCQCKTRPNDMCTKHSDPVEVIVKVLPFSTTATTTTTTTTTATWVTAEKTTTTTYLLKVPSLIATDSELMLTVLIACACIIPILCTILLALWLWRKRKYDAIKRIRSSAEDTEDEYLGRHTGAVVANSGRQNGTEMKCFGTAENDLGVIYDVIKDVTDQQNKECGTIPAEKKYLRIERNDQEVTYDVIKDVSDQPNKECGTVPTDMEHARKEEDVQGTTYSTIDYCSDQQTEDGCNDPAVTTVYVSL